MDDSCAVCAENLEWVAYGACGHRDVCSTCVSRLRFICDDRRCCICKTEPNVIFVTKALGDYTKMINDFSVLPTEVREGRVGPYWYHEDTQAFFDDADHYRMIKAMCKLSCSECDKEQSNDRAMPMRRGKFRNIEQLKGHLFHQHRLLMCSLCLEGRKVFICEQKLYTRAQLNQHINTGDSDVDGTESERGGFTGHPICEFCKAPFYGENELYSHMSTEHYTCHICQRQHPGQHDYYKNYDDLEIHFRRDHYLCEDEACLAKKFIVFQSEAEIKRHNAVEHGGRMSRAQRIAALQIPTSFRYRRRNDDNRRGRERTSHREPSDNDYHLSLAIEASLETASDPPTSSTTHVVSDRGDINDIDSLVQPFESLSATDSESSYRYRQALGGGSLGAPLQGTSFPPLSTPSSTSQQVPVNTMAAHLRRQKNKFNRNTNAISSAQEWPARSRRSVQVARSSSQVRPATNVAAASSLGNSNGFPQLRNASSATNAAAASSLGNSNGFPQLRNASSATNAAAASSLGNSNGFPQLSNASSREVRPVTNAAASSSFGNSCGFPQLSNASSSHSQMQVQSHPTTAADILKASGSRMSAGNTSRISHSSSAPDLTNEGFSKHSVADFPPVSSAQRDKQSSRSQVITNVKDVQSANKSLVEKMQAALDYDEEKYTAFKEISGQYRRGVIGTSRYFDYTQQYGLSHLVLELARLCPDLQKQKQLIDTYNASLQSNILQVNGEAQGCDLFKDNNASKKWKGKSVDTAGSNSMDAMADSIMTSVRKLQSSHKPSEEEVEVLSKDDYRPVKGNSRLMVNEQLVELKSTSKPLINIGGKNDSVSAYVGPKDGVGGSKQRKKTSKFHRVRLGDGSMGALLDLKHSDPDPDPAEAVNNKLDSSEKSSGALPVKGVWKKGGGKKLFS